MRTKAKRVFLKNINSIIEDIADMICVKEKKAFIEKAKKLQQIAQVFNAEIIEEKIHNDIGVKMKDFATKKDIDSLETKVDSLETKLNAKIDSLETKLNAKIDSLETKVDSLETKLNAKIDKKITKMTVTLIIVTITTCSLMTTFLSIFLSINK